MMRMRLIGYLLMTVILLTTAALVPRAWATPNQTRPGQTVPTPTPRGGPTPRPEPPTTQPPTEPSPTLAPGAPTPTPGQASPTPTASVEAAGLVFVKEMDRRQVWPGVTVRYTLTLTNRGANSVRQVVITDPLPPELAPGEIVSGAARWDGQIVRAETLILPPGGQLAIVFTAIVRGDVAPGRVVVNRASASAAGGASLTAAATAILPPAELPPTGGLRIADWGLRICDLRVDRLWPSLIAAALALALYARTLAPGLTWAHAGADGGDLLAAALTAGVPHPPGYPLYQLLLRAALSLVPGDPARTGNWLSAIGAALAVGLLTDLARRTLAERPWRGVVALSAGLVWAASPTLWGQAVITEVYTLNALIVVALLWLAWQWRAATQNGHAGTAWLIAASGLLGLGLGNHLTLVWLLPGLATWLWSNRAGLRRMPAWGWIAAAATGLAGLSVYAYLPLMAAAAPPINWGDPRTPAQFWWLVSSRAYRGVPFGVELAYLPGRLAAWVADTLRQFGGPWGALIALAGLWRIDQRDHAWWRLTGLIALAFSIYAIGYDTADSFVYLIPVWAIAALWLAAGVDWGLQIADCRLQMADGKSQIANGKSQIANRKWQFAICSLQFAVLLLLPGISLARFWGEMDLSRDREASDYVAGVMAAAAPEAVILTAGDEPTFALWYARYGLRQRPDLIPLNVNLYVFPWYRETLAHTHPALVEMTGGTSLPPLDQLVARLMTTRPVYRAEPLNVTFPGVGERPAGRLVQMMVDK